MEFYTEDQVLINQQFIVLLGPGLFNMVGPPYQGVVSPINICPSPIPNFLIPPTKKRFFSLASHLHTIAQYLNFILLLTKQNVTHTKAFYSSFNITSNFVAKQALMGRHWSLVTAHIVSMCQEQNFFLKMLTL